MDGAIRNGMVVLKVSQKLEKNVSQRRKFPREESLPEIGEESFPVNNLILILWPRPGKAKS